MPNTAAKVMLPADFADAPISVVRRSVNALVTVAAVGAVVLVLLPLGAVFGYLIYKGIGSINLAFLTQIPKPPGEPGGGMANAIAGSVYILMIASVFGVPLGIGAGIYLSEYGRGTRFGNVIRFTADVLNGVPSIIVGIVAYGLVVLSQGHFSALAGGVALAIMMVPTITRTTEEMLLLVPQIVREAAYGLGVSRWRTTLSITLRTATSGVITGVMLAFARVAGETAPLLFTGVWQPILELEDEPAHGGLVPADFHLCHFALRRVAQASVGRSINLDCSDRRFGRRCATCGQPRYAQGSELKLWALESKSTS